MKALIFMRNNLLVEVKKNGNMLKLLSPISSITMAPKPPKDLWPFFHCGEKQNTSHWKAIARVVSDIQKLRQNYWIKT